MLPVLESVVDAEVRAGLTCAPVGSHHEVRAAVRMNSSTRA